MWDRVHFYMPQITKVAKRNDFTKRSARVSSSWTWASDPQARWQQHFDAWRTKISEFRRWEKNAFLPARDKGPLHRAHLGWVCQLIAEGQQLAVELTNTKSRQRTQLKNLDNFLDNLRTTFFVWHAPETVSSEQNPLSKYFD